MAHLLRRFPIRPIAPQPSEGIAVKYDQSGTGYPTTYQQYINATTYSINSVATAGSYLIVDVVTDRVPITSVQYGGSSGTAMQLLSSVTFTESGLSTAGMYSRYGLPNVSGGPVSLYITFGGNAVWTCISSMSYLNVTSQATTVNPVTSTTAAISLSNTISCPVNNMVVNGFMFSCFNSPSGITSPAGGDQRFNLSGWNGAGVYYVGSNIADASTTKTFTGTISGTASYARFYTAMSTVLAPAI